jgi:SAM-dependent methyltransferase
MDLKDYQKNINKNNLHFWYKARLIFIKTLLTKYKTMLPDNPEILDIGCGTGTELKILKNFGRVSALDINDQALLVAKKTGCQIIKSNLEEDELDKNKFDLICAFDILEHLGKDEEVLHKIYSSLKKNGLLILTVPACPLLFGPHDIALEHKRRYSKKSLISKIKKTGLNIKTIGYWNSLLFPLEALFRIFKIILSKIKKQKSFQTETKIPSKFLNIFFFYLLNLDNFLFKKTISIPFGLSIYLVAKKK